ncbi:MAG: hypothetical protein RL448_559 [Actinomycetota bacterium]
MPPKVILFGPMGAGKSTVGVLLSEKLNCDFADTDKLIEADQGKSINEIFVEDGESHFRLVEESVVIDALLESDGVVSLGGGAILSEATQSALRESNGLRVFLDISLAAVAPRVGFNTERPLLLVNPRQKWQELMVVRRPIYEALSDLKIDVSDLKIEEIVDQIIQAVKIDS